MLRKEDHESIILQKYVVDSLSLSLSLSNIYSFFITTKWISSALQGPVKVTGYTKNVVSSGTNTIGVPVSALHAAFHASRNA